MSDETTGYLRNSGQGYRYGYGGYGYESGYRKLISAAETPLFNLDFSGGGLDALSSSLTINGQTELPLLEYDARNATASSWSATYGETLSITGAGSDVEPNQGTPLPSSVDESVKFVAAKYFAAPNTTFGDVTTEDIVLEVVFKTPGDMSSSKMLLHKQDESSPNAGWAVRLSASATLDAVLDNGGSDVGISTSALETNTWYHAIFFGDRSGSGVWYLNGVQQTAGAALAGSLTNADTLEVGKWSTQLFDGSLAHAAMWKKNAWLDTHLQGFVAKRRFHKLTGLEASKPSYPTEAPAEITINGTTNTPEFRYDADNATTALWSATYGPDLPIAGSGADITKETSTGWGDNRGVVKFNAGKYFQASSSGEGNLDNGDLVFEILRYTPASGTVRYLLAKDGGAGAIWALQTGTSNQAIFAINNGSGGATFVSGPSVNTNVWAHDLVFVDRSGFAVVYTNGVAGSAVDISGQTGSLSNANKLTLGAFPSGVLPENSGVQLIQAWQLDGWLDTHDQHTLAQQRYFSIFGPGLPSTQTRNTAKHLVRYDGGRKLFLIGAGWPSVEKWPDSDASETLTGYGGEPAATNLILQSEDLTTTWATSHASDTVDANATASPRGDTTADRVTASGFSSQHGVEQVVSLSAAEYTISAFVKADAASKVHLHNETVAGADVDFDLATGTATQVGGAVTAQSITEYADGWYHIEHSFVANAGNNTLSVHVVNNAGDHVYVGGGESLFLWGVQLETGRGATSYIRTTTSSSTRAQERLIYDATNNLSAEGARLVGDYVSKSNNSILTEGVLAVSDGGSSSHYAAMWVGSGGKGTISVVEGGVQANFDAGSSLRDGDIHEVSIKYANDYADLKLDGVIGGTDNTVVVPVTLDRIEVGGTQGGIQGRRIVGNAKIYEK